MLEFKSLVLVPLADNEGAEVITLLGKRYVAISDIFSTDFVEKNPFVDELPQSEEGKANGVPPQAENKPGSSAIADVQAKINEAKEKLEAVIDKASPKKKKAAKKKTTASKKPAQPEEGKANDVPSEGTADWDWGADASSAIENW